MRLNIFLLALVANCGFWGMSALAQSGSEPLFQLKGKSFSASDLPLAAQQQLHDLEMEFYNQKKAVIEDLLLDQEFTEQAKSKKKDAAKLKEEALSTGEPSESELKTFYEQNKEKIPPTMQFDQIKGQLQQIVKQQKMVEKRNALIQKLLADKSTSIQLKKPVAPNVEIAWQGFPEKGSASAKVVVVEFADYKCPHCKLASEAVNNIWQKYKNKVRFVYMDFPIKGEVSKALARGSYCANAQKKFWEYHDAAFAKQDDLTESSAPEIAKTLGLDKAAFDKCLASKEAAAAVDKSTKEGERIGVSGTPSIFVNGEKLAVTGKYEDSLADAIDSALLTN